MGLRPLTGAAQTAADIKVALIPVVFLPVAGRLGQLPVRVEPGPVGVDPLAELLPAADEGFVGDLDIAGGLPRAAQRGGAFRASGLTGLNSGRGGRLTALGGDQASVGQLVDDLLDGRSLSLGGDQLVERGAALGVLRPLAGLGEPQEDAAADLELPGAGPKPVENGVGPMLERPCTAPISW